MASRGGLVKYWIFQHQSGPQEEVCSRYLPEKMADQNPGIVNITQIDITRADFRSPGGLYGFAALQGRHGRRVVGHLGRAESFDPVED